MKGNEKIFCVISHTHWDREWYMPHEHFRHRLIDMLDRLLPVLQADPRYIFHLDAQTVVLEDYLAVRPSKRDLLKKFITENRLIIGPWYLQNDFYLTSGEATVRNLLEGEKLCKEFGGGSKVGYAADQFGIISQLPQILRGFDIDNFIFSRGFSCTKTDENGNKVPTDAPTEFIWRGADGTEALAIYMRHFYNNAQRFSSDIDKAERHLKMLSDRYDNEFTFTPYILLMNGCDHIEAQLEIRDVIEGISKRLPEGQAICQYNLDDYVSAVKEYISINNVELDTVTGELRYDKWITMLQGTLSSRAYIKSANNEAQIMLENRLEPLYSMMELQGMRGIYPHDRLVFAWKNLLKNHPHDSICGCSVDPVHRHMENRFEELSEYTDELLSRAMRAAAEHTALFRASDENNYIITACNTLSVPQSGVAEVTLRIKCDDFENFKILDSEGKPVRFVVRSKRRAQYDVYSPINLPGWFYVWEYKLYIDVGTVRPYSFKSFIVVKSEETVSPIMQPQQKNKAVIENERLRVSADLNGRIDITDIKSGRVFSDTIHFEDIADVGDSYTYVPAKGEPLYADNCVKAVTVLEDTELSGKILVEYDFLLPASYIYAENKRSDAEKITKIRLYLTLKKGDDKVLIDYEIENASTEHALRICFDGDVSPIESYADSPFDIIRRTNDDYYPEIVFPVAAENPECRDKTAPNTSFAALMQNGRGFAVFTVGAHQYEHPENKLCRLAFTLVRANGRIAHYATENWATPENQCLRTVSGRMALCLFDGTLDSADIPNKSLCFRAPLLAASTACDSKKFSGGRPCVQDTTIAEYFYLPDLYSDAATVDNLPALSVEGKYISVTALKQSEDERGIILRFYNYSSEPCVARVNASGRIYKTRLNEVLREYLGDNGVELIVSPKEIVTIYIEK